MSITIMQNLVPASKYPIKCPYTMTPTRLVIHNTANDAPAINEIAYMIKNNLKTSFHFAVDDKDIVQGIPLDRNSWNAGDGTSGIGNRQGIAIEICYSKSGGDRFALAEKRAVDLIVFLLKKYGWGLDKVTKHQDYSGKYCPHRTLDLGWNRFLKMIDAKLNPIPTPEPEPEPVYPYVVGSIIYPVEDVNLLKTAGYADTTPLLIKRGTTCKVMKYHSKNGLYMALANKNGEYFSSAWSKEFNKFSYTSPFMEEVEQLKKDVAEWTKKFNELSVTSTAEIEQLKIELKELSDKYTTEVIARKTAENDRIKAVSELNAYKKGRFIWVVDLLEKLFPKKK